MQLSRTRAYYDRNRRWIPPAFFILGFVFDAVTLQRIDELWTILQQAAYLIIVASLTGLEIVESAREVQPHRFIRKIWQYREAAIPFFLGALLNCYALFFFKSASSLTSFVFITVIGMLLVLQEFKKFGAAQTRIHMALLGLCLISFFEVLSPILFGSIGIIPFVCGMVASLGVSALYYRVILKWLNVDAVHARSQMALPFLVVHGLFAALYFGNAIPPVPLSVTYMGIYHDVRKIDEKYELSYERSPLQFWQNGDQTFRARPGDVIHCYVQIFAPTGFTEQLQVRWLYRDSLRGWKPADGISMNITGGRDGGFRFVTKKTNYEPGDWRVLIETHDGREVGWISLTVEPDDSVGERALTTVSR